MAEYTLKNEELTVTFRTQSAEIRSIRDNKTGQEYMWQADPAFWGWTSPVLFPLVGPVAKNEFRYRGKTYGMKQHGFARQSEFDLCEMEGADIGFVLTDNEERLALYPFRFRLEVGYRLSERTLTVLWKVTNPSEDEDLHFQIGAHPAFNTPPAEGMKKNDCFIGFDTEGPLTVSLLNLGGDPGLSDETMQQEIDALPTDEDIQDLQDQIDALPTDQDVADALRENRIAAFCADVLTEEPPRADNPLLSCENAFITPHIAWATNEARIRLIAVVIDNVKAFVAGKPINVVS